MYLFVLFCIFLCCSMYCLFCVVLCIVCVHMCTELLPPGGYPIAVKYIVSYHIIIRALLNIPIFCHLAPFHGCDLNNFPAANNLIPTTSVSICVQSFNVENKFSKSLPQATKSTHKTVQCHGPKKCNSNIPLCATGQNVLTFAFTSQLKPRRRMKLKNTRRTLHGSYLVSLYFNTLREVKPEIPALLV
jgi:hypothetical protein